MRFSISHRTQYEYRTPASESFAELRVWPRDTATQTVRSRRLVLNPAVPVGHYDDYFGNHVEYFSIPYRHSRLEVKATAEVETHAPPDLAHPLGVTVGEARQIFNSQMYQLFDFLQPTEAAPLGEALAPLRRRFFAGSQPLGEAALEASHWIHEQFHYQAGVTDVSTPLAEVISQRRGVCQDFAHLLLAILRTAGLPARYVSGYIEATDPRKPGARLVGAAASHAWVELYVPGGAWWGLDPTNDQPAGERHVVVAVGRDYHDVAPMRGTYKGAYDQKLQVMVSVQRREDTPAPQPEAATVARA